MPIEVAIVEDKAEVREGITFLLNSDDRFRCCGSYGTAEDAIEDILRNAPDIVLMDIELPGKSGIEAIKVVKSRNSSIQIMMLTVFEDNEKIFNALKAGASGYLVKNTPPRKILEAIEDLHSGGAPMSNQIARRVVEYLRPDPNAPHVLDDLSEREREVLYYLAEGLLYKEIAETLNIALTTVRTHIHKIYEKLHVDNKAEAIKKARGDRKR